jgi:hypothetical protein
MTPKYETRCILGGGTSAARRAMKASGVKVSVRTPFFQVRLRSTAM